MTNPLDYKPTTAFEAFMMSRLADLDRDLEGVHIKLGTVPLPLLFEDILASIGQIRNEAGAAAREEARAAGYRLGKELARRDSDVELAELRARIDAVQAVLEKYMDEPAQDPMHPLWNDLDQALRRRLELTETSEES